MFKVGVIGAGSVSNEHLHFLAASPSVEVVALSDSSDAMAQFAALRFSVPRYYLDYAEMLRQEKLDVVHVLTPPQTHFEVCRACLEAGAHVICEKPLSLNESDLDKLFEIAHRKGLALIEDQNYRFNRPVRWLQKIVEQPGWGHIRTLDIDLSVDLSASPPKAWTLNSTLEGGVAHDFLPHLAYLTHLFLPGNYVLQSFVTPTRTDSMGRLPLTAVLVFENSIAKLRVAFDEKPEAFRIKIRSDQEIIETELFNPYYLRWTSQPSSRIYSLKNLLRNGRNLCKAFVTNILRKIARKSGYEGLHVLLKEFYLALAEGKPIPIKEQEIRASHRLVQRIITQKTST